MDRPTSPGSCVSKYARRAPTGSSSGHRSKTSNSCPAASSAEPRMSMAEGAMAGILTKFRFIKVTFTRFCSFGFDDIYEALKSVKHKKADFTCDATKMPGSDHSSFFGESSVRRHNA